MSLVDSRDADDLDVGDVIVIDRSVGEIKSHTFATVVAIGARGPRTVGPSYPVATYASALKIERKTTCDRIVGRDDIGAYHLLRRDRDGFDVVDILNEPDADPEYSQPVADDHTLGRWIRHVEEKRGWDVLADEFVELTEGGESA